MTSLSLGLIQTDFCNDELAVRADGYLHKKSQRNLFLGLV